jgi:hypothetical protein
MLPETASREAATATLPAAAASTKAGTASLQVGIASMQVDTASRRAKAASMQVEAASAPEVRGQVFRPDPAFSQELAQTAMARVRSNTLELPLGGGSGSRVSKPQAGSLGGFCRADS